MPATSSSPLLTRMIEIDVGVVFQEAVAALRRTRRATYRLQLGGALGFGAVGNLGPYLQTLGVSDSHWTGRGVGVAVIDSGLEMSAPFSV